MNTATFRRGCAATGLAATAVLSAASVLLQPPFPADPAARLAALHTAGPTAAVSAATFVLAQLPMLAGVIGIVHLLRRSAPVLGHVGGLLAVLGAFGHAAFGGVSLVTLLMAGDVPDRAVFADLLRTVEGSPVMVFAALGTVGTVAGLLLLSVGLARGRVVPLRVPVMVSAFLVTEFAGAGLGRSASYLSVLLLVLAFGELAVAVWRSPAGSWELAGTPSTTRPVPSPLGGRRARRASGAASLPG